MTREQETFCPLYISSLKATCYNVWNPQINNYYSEESRLLHYNSKKTKFSSYLDFNNSNPIYLSKTD